MKATLSMPKGLMDLMEDLAALDQDMDVVAAEALQAGAETALDLMLPKIHVEDGDLLDTFKVGKVKREGNVTVIDVGQLHGTPQREAIKANVFEYGSSSMRADPIVRPAMEKGKGKITKAMRKKLEERGLL